MTALNKIYTGLLLLFSISVNAQNLAWKAKLEPVSAAGFYQVPLRPDVLTVAKTDLADLRLLDDKNNNVSFIIRQPQEAPADFLLFPIIYNATDSQFTTIHLNLKEGQSNDHVYLVMANTTVERLASVSGSNDGKVWYIIKENLTLTNASKRVSDKFVQLLQYPLNRYRFLKLKIDNQKSDPINIVQAGVYNSDFLNNNQQYLLNKPVKFIQKDSNNKTYLYIQQQKPFVTDRIKFTVTGPPFFKRRAFVFTSTFGKQAKSLISTFDISSASEPTVILPSVKASALWIEIENDDNAPLKFNVVTTYVLQRYLVAYLEKGKAYYLAAGNEQATSPKFDLTLFKDSIAATLPEIRYGALRKSDVVKRDDSSYNLLWPAVIIMMLALAALTFRLLKDVGKKTE